MRFPALGGGVAVFLLVVVGCATTPPDPGPAPDHPADPRTAEAPPPAVSHTLDVSADEVADLAPRAADVGAHGHGHAHHGHAAPPATAPVPATPATAPGHAGHEGHHP